ncbi:uncharacterized protein LOC115695286 [Cannabis sativa]|uniref:uncharacterized protein LOC115695286 n=1 Tax=Cannabis sativa TaxID=3483 RepID=UPI0011DFFF16|nr:uncharacterized protein LOC115695286 [Cannabis sativa]
MVREGIDTELAEEDELDPCVGSKKIVEPMKDVEEVPVCDLDLTKILRLGKSLELKEKEKIIKALRAATDVFYVVPRRHDRYATSSVEETPLDPVKAKALEKEVDKLLASGMIPNVYYPEWLANLVLVPKPNGTWRAALRFEFTASNNEVEYEALIAGLRLEKVVGAARVEVFSDSQLVVNQVSGECQMRGEKMAVYVAIFWELLHEFADYKVERIPREKNAHTDCLAKLASDREIEKLEVVPVERLTEPSIRTKNIVATVEQELN